MTLREAADLLNVSFDYAARLVDGGAFVLTLESVLAYRVVRDRQRKEALDELVRLTEEFGGYDLEFGSFLPPTKP